MQEGKCRDLTDRVAWSDPAGSGYVIPAPLVIFSQCSQETVVYGLSGKEIVPGNGVQKNREDPAPFLRTGLLFFSILWNVLSQLTFVYYASPSFVKRKNFPWSNPAPGITQTIRQNPLADPLAALLAFYYLIAVLLRDEKGGFMKWSLFLSFILYSIFVLSSLPAAAENQTWKLRPGDNLDIIATTLEIPREEIKKHNPGILENNLQIDQKLKLPLRSFLESKTLEEELSKKDERIGKLESKSNDLEKIIASAESQLRWHPIWLWGFWICFGILAFIFSGVYWMLRQTHPRVFEQPHERSISDLRESQIRARPSFPYNEQDASTGGGQWQLSLKLPHAR